MHNKICFFIGSLYRGGAERVISILANHYSQQGWDVEIALLLNTTIGYDLDKRIRIIDLSQKTGSYFSRFPKWIKGIRKHVQQSKPSIIVSFIGRINVLVLTACLGLRIPIIVSERNDPKHDGRSAVMLEYCNLIYMKAKAVIYQTKYEQSCFSSRLKNGVVIPNPVSVTVQLNSKKNPHEIVTVGRLQPQKNHAMLLVALSEVVKNYPDTVLRIYGDGGLRKQLEKMTKELQIDSNTEFCGNVLDLHNRINEANVFVLCSNYEGLSNALIEAMMLGMVCISTDYPGAEEVIINGVNGFLVPRNNASRLADIIQKVFVDRELSNDISKKAVLSSKQYTEYDVIKLWDAVIERQINVN